MLKKVEQEGWWRLQKMTLWSKRVELKRVLSRGSELASSWPPLQLFAQPRWLFELAEAV
jgi:hypothetical protein